MREEMFCPSATEKCRESCPIIGSLAILAHDAGARQDAEVQRSMSDGPDQAAKQIVGAALSADPDATVPPPEAIAKGIRLASSDAANTYGALVDKATRDAATVSAKCDTGPVTLRGTKNGLQHTVTVCASPDAPWLSTTFEPALHVVKTVEPS